MQVDTAPSDRFADKRYQTFSWRAEVPTGVPESMESLYRLSTTVREVVATALQKKGYRYEQSGGDFVVSYAFGARLEGGTQQHGARFWAHQFGHQPESGSRRHGQRLCVERPKGSRQLMLSFEDGENCARMVCQYQPSGGKSEPAGSGQSATQTRAWCREERSVCSPTPLRAEPVHLRVRAKG